MILRYGKLEVEGTEQECKAMLEYWITSGY